MAQRRVRFALILIGLLWGRGDAQAQEWTRFRGANGAGVGAGAAIPIPFTEADIRWKTDLPGIGHSSPVLWGERIFLTSVESGKGKRSLHCLDAKSGKILWTRDYPFQTYHTHEYNSAASATATVDRQHVYVTWAAPDSFLVLALDHNGKEIWRRDLGAYPTQHGGAASPMLVGEVLVVTKEPEEEQGGIYGLNRRTGAILWKRERFSKIAPYSTPLLYQQGDRPAELLFSSASFGLTSLDPKTGALNWEVKDLFRNRCVSSPIRVGDFVFLTAGNGSGDRQAYAIRPGAAGKPPEIAYRMTRDVSYVPTPIAVGNRLFNWGDNGIVACYDAPTGKLLWTERVGGRYFGSPVCLNGNLLAMSAQGELVALEASGSFKIVGRMKLDAPSHATPAIANGTLYLRTERSLMAVGARREQ